jgi:cytochrome b pre-mRNA-processing protein 3
MDRSLRELGVGDLSVGKKVRKMAEAFYGRVAAYDKALSEEASAFEEALARNVYPDGAPPAGLAALAAYARRVRRSLAATDAETLRRGGGGFEEAGR